MHQIQNFWIRLDKPWQCTEEVSLRYRSASNTKLFLPLIRFYSLPVHITFAISLPSSLHDPLGRRHWSLSFTHKLSQVSKSLTSLFGMRHLNYGTNFHHLFVFLVSRPPQSALLHRQALTAPKSVVGVSHRVFHSHLKTHLFSRSFPP